MVAQWYNWWDFFTLHLCKGGEPVFLESSSNMGSSINYGVTLQLGLIFDFPEKWEVIFKC